MAVGWLKDEVRNMLAWIDCRQLQLKDFFGADQSDPLAGDERDENGEEAVGRGLRSKAKASKKGNIAINGAWESLEARLEALENENKILKTNLEALEIIKHEILKTNLEALKTEHEALKTEHALLQRCIEVEEVDGGGATKLHVKSECEFNVHGDHTTHGHHAIKGGNLFVSNGLGSSKCSSSSSVNEDGGDGNDTTIECSGMGNIIVGHQHDDLSAGHRAITGSHNIILGEGHTVTSHGGIVSGVDHVASGAHASVISGSSHAVSGAGAIALGGAHGTASGENAVVSGGWSNTASGRDSSVSGGLGNTAEGLHSSIS
ncbi:hypothetical protein THAOC_10593, partial [Thalassiosira oceanica]